MAKRRSLDTLGVAAQAKGKAAKESAPDPGDMMTTAIHIPRSTWKLLRAVAFTLCRRFELAADEGRPAMNCAPPSRHEEPMKTGAVVGSHAMVAAALSHPPEWHEKRCQGIGGSDARRVLDGDWLVLWE